MCARWDYFMKYNMATASDFTENPLISCSICLEDFTNPKLLACFHTFCQLCIQRHMDKHGRRGQFKCPMCRTPIDIPASGSAKDFQTNFYMDTCKVGRTGSSVVPCDLCGTGSHAVMRCLNCEENYCSTCGNAHTKAKVSRQHHTVDITDPVVAHKVVAHQFCMKHKKEAVRFFCRHCNELLCIDCKLTDHENHASKDVADVADEIRRDLITSVSSGTVSEKVRRLSEHQSKMKQNFYNSQMEQQTSITRIRDRGRNLKTEIDLNCQRLEQELETAHTEYDTTINAIRKQTQEELNFYSTLTATVEHILNAADDTELILQGQKLIERVNALLQGSVTDTPTLSPPAQFVVGPTIGGAVERLIGTMTRQSINNIKKHTRDELNVCSTLMATAEHTLDAADDTEIIHQDRKLTQRGRRNALLEESITDTPTLSPPARFAVGPSTGGAVEGLIGTMTRQSEGAYAVPRSVTFTGKIELLSKFVCHKTHAVIGITPCDGKNTWITQRGLSTLSHINMKGQVLETVDIGFRAYDVTSDPRGGLYISCRDDKCIRYVSPQREVTTLTTTTDYPQGLVYSENHGGLLVCTTKTSRYDQWCIEQQGRILKVSDGVQQSYMDTKGLNLGFPARIAVAYNNHVCVTDIARTNECVIIVSPDGEHYVRYSGQRGCDVWLYSVCCDNHGHEIIVGDKSRTIHVLSPRGCLLWLLSHSELSELRTWSVAVDREGRLWVGRDKGQVLVFNYG